MELDLMQITITMFDMNNGEQWNQNEDKIGNIIVIV